MQTQNTSIRIMQLCIKFNKLNEQIRKINSESFQIEYTEKRKKLTIDL